MTQYWLPYWSAQVVGAEWALCEQVMLQQFSVSRPHDLTVCSQPRTAQSDVCGPTVPAALRSCIRNAGFQAWDPLNLHVQAAPVEKPWAGPSPAHSRQSYTVMSTCI